MNNTHECIFIIRYLYYTHTKKQKISLFVLGTSWQVNVKDFLEQRSRIEKHRFPRPHVPTPTAAAAWRANTAVSKMAWWPWPFDLDCGVQVTCDGGYLCANFGLPRPLCSRLRPDVHDRQTDVTQHHHFMPPPIRGGGIIRSLGYAS